MNNDRIVVLDGARTPIGSFGGMFKDVPAFELGATAAVEALSRAKVDPADIREVVMGCIGQVGPDAYNARRVAVRAGLSTSVPAYTVNRLCGSGLQAVWSAAMEMRWNDLDFVLAGGDESMTRMPFYDFGGRSFINAIIYRDINTCFSEAVNHSPANPSRAAGNQRNPAP